MKRVGEVGGTIVKEPQTTECGGYGRYFQDRDGYYWEVVYGENCQFDENDMLIIK
uniref:VOC family protein n=1 Tax=Candidatus Enterococcus willemsii TaxID=1857215 RepID=UPI00403FB3B8